jgi:methyl-accepting chemotaxis protein
MFQYRSSAFGPSVAAIQKHLGAVEKELEKIGRIAGDRTSAAAATASDQIGDAISTILNEMVERFRQGRQAAGDQAGRLSNQAAARNHCHRAWHRDFNWRRGFDQYGRQPSLRSA